jgi:hypothetical protein
MTLWLLCRHINNKELNKIITIIIIITIITIITDTDIIQLYSNSTCKYPKLI